jgi:thiosulfate dehydrogenase [quinone] large subunit
MKNKERFIWAALRIGMGWLFLWPFLDKLFGLGFATAPEDAWIAGGSPTLGYLKFATSGPLAPLFQSLAGDPVVDWAFMLGLLFIGLALVSGIGVKIAGYSGAVMVLLMWLSSLPPENNPFLDEHIVYMIILMLLAASNAGQWVGLGKWWSEKAKNYSFLMRRVAREKRLLM